MINLASEYIKYQWNAKRRFGIHSPFVYDFGANCLSLFVPKIIFKNFKRLKRDLKKDTTQIAVHDLGAGSKKLKQHRTVRQIAKTSGSNDKYGQLLYRIVKHYDRKNILELGTSLGLGTYMLAAGNEKVKVTTVEGCENTFEIARKYFPKKQRNKVTFINDSFTHFLSSLKEEHPYDLIFIDGDHKSESLYEQLRLLESYIDDETIIILDDIRWSKDMFEAWETLSNSDYFHLSLDLFKMGILMKRTHQQKESFIVRY